MAEERRITKQYLMEHLDENELDLSMINLSKVPVRELVQIPRVTKLDLSRNQITSLPDNISSLKTILELDLSKNQLTGLPESFGELSQLQKLDLYGNKLTELPLTFVGLERLHWLDLKNNPLSQGLAKAAGTCLDEKECKQCAKNVMVYVGEAAAEAEKKKKKTLDRKLARERKKQEEERRRKEEAKREKQELRQRRKKEREREQAQRMAEDHPDSQEEDTGTSTEVDEQESNGAKRTSCGSLCKLLIVLLSLLVVLSLCLFLYCEFTSDPSCKIFYQTAHAYFHRALDLIGISQ